MSRTHLLGAASAVALACLSTGAFAQAANTITGGGSTLAEFDYFKEFALYNANVASGAATFSNPDGDNANDTIYWPSGSGSGQSAFLNNNLSIDAHKVNANIPLGNAGGANAVSYGASDATLSPAQIAGWGTANPAGHLIQLPSLGVGISFPVVNSKVTANGATASHVAVKGGIALTDDDLCGIFSGKITNWSQTSAAAGLTAGTINVVYRSDGSGTSFLLLNHLSAVCTTANSYFSFPITVSTTFANAGFVNAAGTSLGAGVTPSNFTGESGSSGVANYLSNVPTPTTPVTSAIGYLSPDFTTVDPASNAVLGDGTKSKLVVAAVKIAGVPVIPTVRDVTSALNRAKLGTTLTAPTTAQAAAMPQNFVPLIQTVSAGYPVVGYTTLDFAQCYQNQNVALGIISFLKQHYNAGAQYSAIISNNGFVSISATGAKVFSSVITNQILGNTHPWNDNIQNATACKGLPGR